MNPVDRSACSKSRRNPYQTNPAEYDVQYGVQYDEYFDENLYRWMPSE